MTERHDVVVVGGGLAGLAAGRTLQAAGTDAVVLEARDRVGGKTLSTRTDYGDVVEYGGQWVGADQDRVLALLDEYDVETRPQYGEGAVVGRLDGDRFVADTYEDLLASIPDAAATDLFEAFEEIERCVEQVPADRPQDAPEAEAWDATTLRTWADRQFDTPEARATFERMVPGIYTAEPGDVSFLFFCYYARTAGGFDMVAGLNHERDSHADVVVDVQSIARSIAADLGDAVRCGQPVRRIVQTDGGDGQRGGKGWRGEEKGREDEGRGEGTGVAVRTPTRTYTADYAIVALPPTLAGRLDYEPALPAARDELTQRMPNGAVVKCHLRYEAPFWRSEGFSGFVEDDVGPADYYFDDGVPGGETGRLVGFVCGDNARTWGGREREERRSALLDQLVDVFEEERFTDPIDYRDQVWNAEPCSRGAYHGYPTPGTMTACWDAIRKPVGRVHWAGAETATRWYGHMDGAIRSGERAATEVTERLTADGSRNG